MEERAYCSLRRLVVIQKLCGIVGVVVLLSHVKGYDHSVAGLLRHVEGYGHRVISLFSDNMDGSSDITVVQILLLVSNS